MCLWITSGYTTNRSDTFCSVFSTVSPSKPLQVKHRASWGVKTNYMLTPTESSYAHMLSQKTRLASTRTAPCPLIHLSPKFRILLLSRTLFVLSQQPGVNCDPVSSRQNSQMAPGGRSRFPQEYVLGRDGGGVLKPTQFYGPLIQYPYFGMIERQETSLRLEYPPFLSYRGYQLRCSVDLVRRFN